jgi:peptide/nickel transport system substrate-binding protein
VLYKKSIFWLGASLLLACGLISCQYPPATSAPSITQTPSEVDSPQDSATAEIATQGTAEQVNAEDGPSSTNLQLTICLGQEPQSLFWYSPLSPAARSILAAVYDGPFDRLNFNNLAVILETVPSLAGGDVILEPVSVEPGERVADAQGNLVVLAEGVPYRPAGCTGPDCALTYPGTDPISLDQMGVRFRLRPGLLWADGAALVSADSVFSYQAARALQPQGWMELLDATWSYQALDDLTVEWRGLPGYLGGDAAGKFFQPLPRHVWEGIGWVNLPTTDSVVRNPLGWGPYRMESWQAGEQIVLARNPNYHRASEGLPRFERLVYRFIPDPDQALQDLRNGACDLLDPTAVYESQLDELALQQANGELALSIQPATAWEQLTFGILPASAGEGRVFAQAEVRLAAARCIDRQVVVNQVLAGLAQPADGFFPPGHPYAEQAAAIAYDPQFGSQLLENAGWRDADGNPATPRTAQAVPGFVDGAPLQVEYLVSPEPDRQSAAQIVKAGLESCGFGVEISTLPFAEYLAPGPQGPVFGRSFDLAQFAWPGLERDLCALYLSSEIPGPYPEFSRGWGGGNAGGYANLSFDRACQFLLGTPAEWPDRRQAAAQVQELLTAEAPVLPLYWRFRIILSRPGLCGLEAPVSGTNWLWNLEAFQWAETCP